VKYEVRILPSAERDFKRLSPDVGKRILRKI